MTVLLIIFAVVCLWKIQLRPADNSNYITDYMSIEKTTAIKGIFILIVFFSHFNTYVDFTSAGDIAYLEHYKMIGQRMVTLFMFYSGYGVMEAIKKKKMAYVRKMPVNRILATFFRYDAAVLLFLIMHLILGTDLSKKRILLAFTSWGAIGNSNWYIFAILVCYVLTFISFAIFRDKGKFIPGAVCLLVLLSVYVAVFHIKELQATRYYNTVLCYAIGVFFSLFKEKFDKLFGGNNTLWAVTLFASIIITQVTYSTKARFAVYEISMFSFTLAVVLFTMHISLNNKVLNWFGEHLFSVYMLQRIPMIVFQKLGLGEYNIYLYFVVCLIVTVILAYVFDKLVNPLWSMIANPKKKKIA